MEIIRQAKLWLIRHDWGENYFSFSRDQKVHCAALRQQIVKRQITPEELAEQIFRRSFNFREAYMLYLYEAMPEGGVRESKAVTVPQTLTIDRVAIREYKELLAQFSPETRKSWDPIIAKKLIALGNAEYHIIVSNLSSAPIVKATLADLSNEVCKLLNELGLQ